MLRVTAAAAVDAPDGSGSGRSLPTAILVLCALCSLGATASSLWLVAQHLKSYRKLLQRYAVRIVLMVPIYAISSLVSLVSLEAAFVIDLVRDLYEAFTIWNFLILLIDYLGGERSVIVLAHGRPPKPHPWPMRHLLPPVDISDPYTFLAIKRGVLQYVQIKPFLALVTVVLKAAGQYREGNLGMNGYTFVSTIYNFSVFISLYSLVLFWSCLAEDLEPFRVDMKFICVKGIIFFTFWQSLAISSLVASGLVNTIGPVSDPEYISLAISDMLLCFEMPLFALGHAYAFPPSDYRDPFARHAARLPAWYAARDVLGACDVLRESYQTISGTGYDYQTFEPSEGVVHQGLGRVRRSRAGLRYSQGGKAKYWLPQRIAATDVAAPGQRHVGPTGTLGAWIKRKQMERQGFAPLLPEQAEDVVRPDPEAPPPPSPPLPLMGYLTFGGSSEANDARGGTGGGGGGLGSGGGGGGGVLGGVAAKVGQWAAQTIESLAGDEEGHAGASSRAAQRSRQDDVESRPVGQRDGEDEEGDEEEDEALRGLSSIDFDLAAADAEAWSLDERLYDASRHFVHGDWSFPSVDVAREEARRRAWYDDEDVLERARARRGQKRRLGRLLGQRETTGAEDGDGARTEGRSGVKASSANHAETPAPGGGGTMARKGKARGGDAAGVGGPVDERGSGSAVKGASDKRAASASASAASKRATSPAPPAAGVVDLLVEDRRAEERQRRRERQRGDPALRSGGKVRIFRRQWEGGETTASSASAGPGPAGGGTGAGKTRATAARGAGECEVGVEAEAEEAAATTTTTTPPTSSRPMKGASSSARQR